jgi:hypothetical protein
MTADPTPLDIAEGRRLLAAAIEEEAQEDAYLRRHPRADLRRHPRAEWNNTIARWERDTWLINNAEALIAAAEELSATEQRSPADTSTVSEPAGLDVERLAVVIGDWMPDGADVSVGFDGKSAHLVGTDLARYIFDRAAEYDRLGATKQPDPLHLDPAAPTSVAPPKAPAMTDPTLDAAVEALKARFEHPIGSGRVHIDFSLGYFVAAILATLRAPDPTDA